MQRWMKCRGRGIFLPVWELVDSGMRYHTPHRSTALNDFPDQLMKTVWRNCLLEIYFYILCPGFFSLPHMKSIFLCYNNLLCLCNAPLFVFKWLQICLFPRATLYSSPYWIFICDRELMDNLWQGIIAMTRVHALFSFSKPFYIQTMGKKNFR